MPVTFVQASSVATGTSSSPNVAGFTVTAGNALILMITQGVNRNTTACSDTGGGTWAEQVDVTDATRSVQIWRCVNHPGGTVTVTATLSSSTSWTACLIEVTGQDNTTPDADTATHATPSETNTIVYAAPSTGFDVPAGGFVTFVTRSNSADTATAGTGYTLVSSGAVNYQFGYRAFSTAATDERPNFTKSSGSRATQGGSYAMAEAAGGGGGSQPPRTMHQFRQRG